MNRTHTLRYDPQGHTLRVFSVYTMPSGRFDVIIAQGTANPDTIGRCIEKYGAAEVRRIIPNRERHYRDLYEADVAQRRRVWSNACKRDGLTDIVEQEEGR